MAKSTFATTTIAFFDGSTLAFEVSGISARVILREISGRVIRGLATNPAAAYADFLRQAERRSRTVDPVDTRHFDALVTKRALVNTEWEHDRYLATTKDGGWTAFLVPRGLAAFEKIGYRLVLEDDHSYELHCDLADDLKRVGGDMTVIGAFADRERFVLYDGFLADHGADSTTLIRRRELRVKLAGVASIVFAPEAPAEEERFVPSPDVDVFVRRQTEPYTAMTEHRFESRFRKDITFERTLSATARDPKSPFISPPRQGAAANP